MMLNRILRHGTLSLGNLSLGNLSLGTLSLELGLQAAEFQLQAIVNRWWQALVRIAFGLFVGSLVTLLALLYAGVPVVGS
jgi:hypothetical protein